MVTLYHEASGQAVGEISDEDFQFLQSSLEEESATDDNYYIDEATIELLRNSGASAGLVSALEQAVSANGASEIGWRDRGV